MNFNFNSKESIRNYGKSFYWASFFLPKKNKKEASKLYSLCRHLDDIADNDKNSFNELTKIKMEILDSKNDQIETFLKINKIQKTALLDLIDGLIFDQQAVKIKNIDELLFYSYQVAGTVGIMMCPLIEVYNKKAFHSAIDLGIAMQLTNIARDIFEDAKMNRVYLPGDWLGDINYQNILRKKFSLNEKKLIDEAIMKLINLSFLFYKNGFYGLKFIPLKTRLGIFIASNVYKGIGDKILKSQNVFTHSRVYLNIFEKIFITLKSMILFPFIKILYRETYKLRKDFLIERI